MRGKRLRTLIRLYLIPSVSKRTAWLRKNGGFASIGEHCSIDNRSVPLYPELIRIGNNVHIASNVHFVTHDVIHLMLNNMSQNIRDGIHLNEFLGCIDIKDNVFIGA